MLRFISVLFLVKAAWCGSPITPRIIGGGDADIAVFPYMVTIEMKDYVHICGAIIVSADWALTDAGCATDNINLAEFSIRSGSSLLYNGTLHTISQWIHHPLSYNLDHEFDFALLRVDPPFEFGENVAAVTLVDQDQATPDGAEALIAGWGKSSNISEWFTDRLQFAKVTIFGEAECSELLSESYHSSKLCARDLNGQVTICTYDEGGPLVVNGTLYGIIQWPGNCGDHLNDGYSRVASGRAWIDEIIGVKH